MGLYHFDTFRILIVIAITIFGYIIAIKKLSNLECLFLAFTYAFILLYSGIGGGIVEANPSYTAYYVIYILVLSITLRKASFYTNFGTSRKEKSLLSIIKKHSTKIIVLFFGLKIFDLVYPEFKIMNLISPPPPSLEDHDFEAAGLNYAGGVISSLVYFLSSLVLPLFYLALYKYKNDYLRIVILLVSGLYLTYCSSGYIGRGSMLQCGIICLLSIYYNLSSAKRKMLVISLVVALPFVAFGMYNYSLARIGTIGDNITPLDAVQLLFSQEIGYPLHYDSYINKGGNYISDYLEWLVLQPLPGFLKFGHGNFMLTKEFSMQILGLDASQYGFFILLPGLLGEGLFVFGPFLFVMHAIMLGILLKYCIRTLTSSPTLVFYCYYSIVEFSFILSRGGTVSVYPFMVKSFLILILVEYFQSKKIKNV